MRRSKTETSTLALTTAFSTETGDHFSQTWSSTETGDLPAQTGVSPEASSPVLKNAAPVIEPLAVTIPDAVRLSGLSRSEIYRRAAAGDIRMVKAGSRSLVLVGSIRDYLAGLPPANLRAPKHAA